jgi:3,4-dihydroxy 2-butanone 4-phosphate synthase/GTP cyclohydrolase II
VVYLREGSVGVAGTSGRARDGLSAEATRSEATRDEQWREIGIGAQILKDLGVKSIRLIATRERRYVGLAGFGIVIDATDNP